MTESQPTPLTDRRVVVAIALLCCFLWGSAVPAVKIGYTLFAIAPGDTPSLMLFAGVRFFLAGVILLCYSALTRKPIAQPPRRLAQLALLGLVSTAGQYLLYYIGLAHTTGVKVSITTSTSTFFSVLLAHFLYADDRLTSRCPPERRCNTERAPPPPLPAGERAGVRGAQLSGRSRTPRQHQNLKLSPTVATVWSQPASTSPS